MQWSSICVQRARVMMCVQSAKQGFYDYSYHELTPAAAAVVVCGLQAECPCAGLKPEPIQLR
jgi:hypothetical protein